MSRVSSSSSLEGLAARLKGARQGKGKGAVLPPDEGLEQQEESGKGTEDPERRKVNGKGKGRAVDEEEEDGPAGDAEQPSLCSPSLTSHQTSSLSFPAVPVDLGAAVEGDSPERASSDEDEDEDDDDDVDLPARFEGQPDPRDLLRTQLGRGGTSSTTAPPGLGRTDSGQSLPSTGEGKEVEKGGDAGREGEAVGVFKKYQPRRYFILSTAGKLVWTSDQDEEQAAGLVGVMQAIVSIFADEGDKIRYVSAGSSTRIAFLLKPPLYLVVVSNGWGEPESVLRTHLDYLYLQLLSVVTLTQLQNLFARRSNADLRGLIEGTEPFFHSLTSSLQASALALSVMTSSIEVYRLPRTVREEVAKVVQEGVSREVVRNLDLLYVLILGHGRLVTLLRPKKHSIHPTDLHLLLSTIYSTSPPPPQPPHASLPSTSPSQSPSPPAVENKPRSRKAPLTAPHAEAWFPISLPRFNPKGFLYAYVSFLDSSNPISSSPNIDEQDPDGGVGVVVLSSRRDAFEGVKEVARGVKERLLAPRTGVEKGRKRSKSGSGSGSDGGLVHELEMARVGQEYSLGELALPGLRHFLYKSRALVQVTRPGWEGEYKDEEGEGRKRLITLYQTVHDVLHPRPAVAGSVARQPAQVQYVRTEFEAVLGWITPTFELYVCTSPLLPHSAVVSAARSVSKWVAREEERLFLMGAPTF
ncbi:hypothetical protein JCM11251_003394 [Rhodosporidiobolus azoricus]